MSSRPSALKRSPTTAKMRPLTNAGESENRRGPRSSKCWQSSWARKKYRGWKVVKPGPWTSMSVAMKRPTLTSAVIIQASSVPSPAWVVMQVRRRCFEIIRDSSLRPVCRPNPMTISHRLLWKVSHLLWDKNWTPSARKYMILHKYTPTKLLISAVTPLFKTNSIKSPTKRSIKRRTFVYSLGRSPPEIAKLKIG